MDDEKKPIILENEILRRKRKPTQEHLQEIVENPTKIHQHFFRNQEIIDPSLHKTLLGFNNVDLNLSLSSTSSTLNPTPLPMQPPLHNNNTPTLVGGSSRRGRRARSEGGGGRAPVKTDLVTPPYRWATDKRAMVHSMEYLVSQGITSITGDVQCKKCERSFEIEYEVREKFRELVMFILNEGGMQHRAPQQWIKPRLPKCKFCGEENSCKPLIAEKKRRINWLFLLLGQLLGCCTLEQLKYFCKHTHNHRTGAKDRVLFLSYYTLCKQLDPNGPFNF